MDGISPGLFQLQILKFWLNLVKFGFTNKLSLKLTKYTLGKNEPKYQVTQISRLDNLDY